MCVVEDCGQGCVDEEVATLTAQRDQLVKAAVDVYHGFAISSALRTAGMVQLGNLFDAIYAIAPEALREGIERQPNIHDLVAQRDALRTALEDVRAIQGEYDRKPNLIPVAGWAAIRERLQHADVREALGGKS